MKTISVLAAVIAVSLAKSATLLRSSEITEEMINNPDFLVYETEEGLFRVEDISAGSSNATVFATDDDVTFYVYTFENQNNPFPIRRSQLRNIVALTGFDITRDTLVVIHGWTNNWQSPVNDAIKRAALFRRRINVIVADWSPIAALAYTRAQGSVLAVGNFIGDFLVELDNQLNHRLAKVTIVGHSLGAHVSGNAGARTNGLVSNIIGLDPAGPLFSESNINNRLDPTDARFVQVIHTNDRVLGFGIRMGHTDHYPNGGSTQPGCGVDLVGSCAHSRAYEYFAESLNDDNYLARLCDTYANYQNNRCSGNTFARMGGFPLHDSANGNYFLTTNSASPFAQG